ncbi:Hypothetical protein NTJ_04680 [Nesidiocoris tenuis]|uniref:Uncharacterized protein n=1 Tax=Nesidiocoris tenuis TaxID=355587 RepID=A0ABN7AHY4_9HEMI|nr:Hypothetical protein NTJ_04680 [Nesidiocoris tenuis]
MSFVKYVVGILLVALAAENAQGTVANYLADRAMSRMLSWVNGGGSEWLTMPGGMGQGLNSTKDGYYTLAFAGPQYYRIDEISRTGAAIMGADIRAPPLFVDNQNLTFQVALKNLTLLYKHIAYTNYEGLLNASAQVTTDAIKVNLTISITGDGTKCVASGADPSIIYERRNYINNRDYDYFYRSEIDEAISRHFDSNIKRAVEVFMYAAVVNMFDRYDLCTDRTMSQVAFLKLKNLNIKELSLRKL